RAASISAWTRRASLRSLAMISSRGGQGAGGLIGPVLGHSEKGPTSERLQPVLFALVNGEQLVQLGDLEHLVDLRVDLAQDQLAAGALELAVHGDELAEGGRGEEFDVLEVEQHLPPAEFVDQAEQLLADHLDVLLVEDLLVD